jgi:predicted Na+-dependent transporter
VGDGAIAVCAISIFVGLRRFIVADLGWVLVAAVAFTALAIGAGLLASTFVRADHRQMRTIAIEFSCRNNAILALVGLSVLDRPELAAFALIVFLVQIPLVMGGFLAVRPRDTA